MTIAAVIPARYASTRFPGKPLARQTGKYLIEHVYEQVCKCSKVDQILIATDDTRIFNACREIGAPCEMTRDDHQCGTDRLAEVAQRHPDFDLIVNVQGDEPEIDPSSIDCLVDLMLNDSEAGMGTLCAEIKDRSEIENPNVVKVVIGQKKQALYFSRSPIPYDRVGAAWRGAYRKHLWIYAYRRDMLLAFSRMVQTPLELTEKLEQLRALENGVKIAIDQVTHIAVGIDTPEQYVEFVKRYVK
ncbi:MAG: 3-deoxy-manno-octulosonate cytidylyltransferase [Sedimentisphaerales bacterium]|nr:3-deoxy-manno-octulosonate cytidylyltransferase [Sedimentisphaerales bacterium]